MAVKLPPLYNISFSNSVKNLPLYNLTSKLSFKKWHSLGSSCCFLFLSSNALLTAIILVGFPTKKSTVHIEGFSCGVSVISLTSYVLPYTSLEDLVMTPGSYQAEGEQNKDYIEKALWYLDNPGSMWLMLEQLQQQMILYHRKMISNMEISII